MPVNTYITANGRIRRRITTDEEKVTEQVAVVTNALGSVVATYKDGWLTADRSYDPYGETRAEWNDVGRFGWVGGLGYRETRREWVSHYVRARHYGYPMGMWTSVDPLWPSEPAFGYVGGRPLSFIDPKGMQANKPPTRMGPVKTQPTGQHMAHFRIVNTPCGPIRWPSGVPFPRPSTKPGSMRRDWWPYWLEQLRRLPATKGCSEDTIWRLEAETNMREPNRFDKLNHCIMGCMAAGRIFQLNSNTGAVTRNSKWFMTPCCNYYMAVFLEVRDDRDKSRSLPDFIATRDGVPCGEHLSLCGGVSDERCRHCCKSFVDKCPRSKGGRLSRWDWNDGF
jgi:RHS repeat-associated protein